MGGGEVKSLYRLLCVQNVRTTCYLIILLLRRQGGKAFGICKDRREFLISLVVDYGAKIGPVELTLAV